MNRTEQKNGQTQNRDPPPRVGHLDPFLCRRGKGKMSEENRVQDGQKQCVRGAWVKVAAEYRDWDVFKKFLGRVGRLTTRHLSGMWYAEFAGEDEYSFLCGPLLFQLEYSSAKEAEQARCETLPPPHPRHQ